MKIAIVHEFLTQFGGAEQVLKAILEIYPDADLYTLVYDDKKMSKYFRGAQIYTSFLQKMPLGVKKYKWYLPLMPKAIESFDLSRYDLIISDSSAFAKGAITSGKSLHICYCHTPTRYLWSETDFYLATAGIPFFVKPFMPLVIKKLRAWDYLAAQRPNYILANSNVVKQRIKKYYKRESQVLYPYVDCSKFNICPEIKDYFLLAGRIVPYKRYDIVVRAFNKLNLSLKVVGDGYGLSALKKIAVSNKIEFLGRVSDEALKKYYCQAKAYIFPAEEDFGITPLESMASGRPVIAYNAGGATETVKENLTGTFFQHQTPESIIQTIKNFNEKKYNPQKIRDYALRFDKKIFQQNIKTTINQYLANNK